MNITIFGAGGAIGRIIAEHALENGDTVTAYVRSREGLEPPRGNMIILVGELSNRLLIDKAVENADVVISALGPAHDAPRRQKETPIADGHAVIIQAMEKQNVKRFITLATPIVRSYEDRVRLGIMLPRVAARIFRPHAYREMKGIERLVKDSSLEWTVVRMVNPNAKHGKEAYAVSLGDTPVSMKVSRENVGAFMYRVAAEGSYISRMPIVFNIRGKLK